jgi:hypothetical protein
MEMRTEIIGDATLYLGDCLDILPTLGKVDAVVKSDAAVYTQTHEKSAEWQHRSPARSDENLGTSQGRDNSGLCERPEVTTGNGQPLRRDAFGFPEGADALGDTVEIEGQAWPSERQIQRRDSKHGLSVDGGKRALQSLRRDGSTFGSSHRRDSHEQHTGEPGGSLLTLPHESPQGRVVVPQKGWALLTDVLNGIRTGNGFHPTEKPVDVMQRIVEWTRGTVIDPFMGSGTTGVACANLGRKFIGIELEPKYFDIACRRIETAYKQPRLFAEPVAKAKQESML